MADTPGYKTNGRPVRPAARNVKPAMQNSQPQFPRQLTAQRRADMESHLRSQMQLLLLGARAEIRQELARLRRQINEELEQAVADIRMIRLAAHEELSTQRKYTATSQIRALAAGMAEIEAEMSPDSPALERVA